MTKREPIHLNGKAQHGIAAVLYRMGRDAETAGGTIAEFTAALAAHLVLTEHVLIAEIEAHKEELERAKAALVIITLDQPRYPDNARDVNMLFDAARAVRTALMDLEKARKAHDVWVKTQGSNCEKEEAENDQG